MFNRAMRRRRYRRQYRHTELNAADSQRIAGRLAYLWRAFRPRDFSQLDPAFRATHRVTVWHPTLPALVEALDQQNRYIKEEQDSALELQVTRQGQATTVVLDFYLADENQCEIDETLYLQRLQGLLQEHSYLVSQLDHHYYQRQSERLYQDIIALTQVLMDAIEPTPT